MGSVNKAANVGGHPGDDSRFSGNFLLLDAGAFGGVDGSEQTGKELELYIPLVATVINILQTF